MNDAARPRTILVVDDTEPNRYALARMLTRAGFRTLEAASGAEALTMLDQGPDLVVLDINLPDMLGFEVCKRIKSRPDAPKVLHTSASFTRSEDRIEGLEGGADAYLVQPINPAEFIATIQSLVRLREAEDELRRRNAELQAATEQLERSNRELTGFAYVASHDLQEPLRMVVNYLDLLRRRYEPQLDERAREYIGFAVDGASRMSTMVRDLLALSQAQRDALEPAWFESADAVQDTLANLELRIGECAARIELGELPRVWGDRVQLTRVLQNLVANALKFRHPDRAPVIRIAHRGDAAEHRFEVADNGLGIPPEARARIFEMFQRLHSHAEIPGSGIGLSVCKTLVERHGGRIGVDSAPGDGSTFWFTLPVRRGG